MADYIPIMAYITMPFVFTRVLENWDALFDLYNGEIDAHMRPATEDLNVAYVWSTQEWKLDPDAVDRSSDVRVLGASCCR